MGSLLNTLADVLASRLRKNRKLVPVSTTGTADAAPAADAVGVPDPSAGADNVEPPLAPAESAAQEQEPEVAEYKPPETEIKAPEPAEQELEEDPYEKAVAEAVAKEDELKEQASEEKAEQEQEFWAGKAEQEQEFFKEQDAEKAEQEQEFWADKKTEEIRADLDKELDAVGAEAKQDQEQGKLDQKEAGEIENEMDKTVGEHQAEAEKIEAEGAAQKSEFWPGEEGKVGDFWPGGAGKPQDFWPEGAEVKATAEKEPFFKDVDKSTEPTWLDGPPKDTSDDRFFQNIDRMRTRTGQDIPDGWMKPVEEVSAIDQEAKERAQVAADYGHPDGPPPPLTPVPEGGSNDELIKAYNDRLQELNYAGSEDMVAAYRQKLNNIDLESQLTGLSSQEVAKYKADLQTDPTTKGKFDDGFANPGAPESAEQGMNADLAKLYAERQKDLGKADEGVQEFAGQLKAMEAQSPAPAPEVKSVGPDDLPVAWGGGNMGVVGRVERSQPAPGPGASAPDPPAPPSAPEVQTAAPAPTPAPAPAPAPQQPGPSMSPSF